SPGRTSRCSRRGRQDGFSRVQRLTGPPRPASFRVLLATVRCMERNSVRCRLRWPFVVLAVASFVLLLGGPVAVGLAVLAPAPPAVGAPCRLLGLAFSALLAYAMSGSYEWVELRGDRVRARKLLTRRVIDRPVADLVRVKPLVSGVGLAETALVDALLKTPN